MDERWLPIPGYEGRYDVSDQGRVRSLAWGKERILKTCMDHKGYLQVGLSGGGPLARVPRVHRLVLLAFVGPRPDGMECRHIDGDHQNNILGNLRWGTHSENEFDRVKHGTHHNARKTHCANGHPFDDVTTFTRTNGGRGCRVCQKARDHARNAAKTRNP